MLFRMSGWPCELSVWLTWELSVCEWDVSVLWACVLIVLACDDELSVLWAGVPVHEPGMARDLPNETKKKKKRL